jgi:hypothetical protein
MEGDCYPRSPMYGETLARCTRAVYPSRFFWTTSPWWASVFLWLWLDHMYVYNKVFDMHSPRGSTPFGFSKSYRMCANGVVTPVRELYHTDLHISLPHDSYGGGLQPSKPGVQRNPNPLHTRDLPPRFFRTASRRWASVFLWL